MKKGKFYSGAFIALAMGALVGCSKDDDGTAKVTPDMTTSYANISIVMPSSANTRALNDGNNEGNYTSGDGFDYGTPDENKINSLLLIFYDEQGNVVGSSSPTALTVGDKTGPSIATKYTMTIDLKLNEGSNMPAKVMAYINPAQTSDQNRRLNEIMSLTRTRTQLGDPTRGFIMNNSGYYVNDEYVVAADVDASKIYTKEETATASNEIAAEIYVERVAAKVQVAKAANFAVSPITVYSAVDDQKTYTLTFVPAGWALTAQNTNSMLIKNLNEVRGTLSESLKSWIQTENYRTYWCRSYGYENGIGINTTPTFPAVGTDEEGNLLNYINYDNSGNLAFKGETVTDGNSDVAYTAENTMLASRLNNPSTNDNAYATVTSAVIKGTYTVGDDTNNDFANGFYIRIFSMADGDKIVPKYVIYTQQQLIDEIIKTQNIFSTSDTEKVVADNILELKHLTTVKNMAGTSVPNPANRVTVQIDEDYTGTVYAISVNPANGELVYTPSTVTAINEKLASFVGQAMQYNSCKAFFYVPIKHHASGTENFMATKDIKTGDYGIVRNHSYQLTINKIEGLAIGVKESDSELLLPSPNETQTYNVDASLNVLAWHVMGQSVDL